MPRRYPFTFDPRKKGLRKILGDTEFAIMELLWQDGEASVRDVCNTLQQKREIAYTTVMTVMSRLYEKGLLKRRKQAKAFVYQAAISRDEFTQSVVGSVVEGLVSDFSAPAFSEFIDSFGSQNPERLEELARLIEERRKK